MPKSKRNRVVALTKTKKKNREWKEGLVTAARACFDKYPDVYLFKHHNMRNDAIKQLREDLKEQGRFVMGSNKLLQVALGKTEADEYRTNLHYLSEHLRGSVGLFFTSLSREEAVAALEDCERDDFARVGAKATHDFKLMEGPLEGPTGPIPHTLEAQLRKLGLPTRLNKGVVELIADHTVCTEGQVLDPNQTSILRIFGVKMATFRIKVIASWCSQGEVFTDIAIVEEDEDDDEDGKEIEGVEFPDDGPAML